jgi:hypothetical protein
MPPYKYKTGVKKEKQSKQMYVYTDKWVEMHNKIAQLEHEALYWRIEAQTDHARWMGALEDLDNLRKQYEVPKPNPKTKAKVRRG